MDSTLLSTILSRMKRYQTVSTVETQYLVRDLDSALRKLRRNPNLPFFQKKGSLRAFADIIEYPVASDHDYLIYVDKPQTDRRFSSKLRARYTSLQQFLENIDNRNTIAEIWNNGTLTLGLRLQSSGINGLTSRKISDASVASDYSVSDDASNIVLDNVNFIEGNSSIQFTITDSIGVAGISNTFTGFVNADYKRNYYFRWVYLDSVPTSMELRFGVDSSNYLSGSVTEQFGGQVLVADQWNLVAIDLNLATETGTISTSSTFAYENLILTGAATGVYNVGQTYLRQWALLDYWYYSKYSIQTSGSSDADQEYFYNDSEVYTESSSLVGPSEWTDVIMYEALALSLIDKENKVVLDKIEELREEAWDEFAMIWPSIKPQQTNLRYRYGTEYSEPMDYWNGRL